MRLRSRSSPLGVFPAANWESHEISLAAEDILLLYTDGVTEARRGEEFFGERRLEGLLEREKVPVEHLPTAILEQVERFAGGALRDDIAVLALSFSKADA